MLGFLVVLLLTISKDRGTACDATGASSAPDQPHWLDDGQQASVQNQWAGGTFFVSVPTSFLPCSF